MQKIEKQKVEVAFVILHYIVKEATIKCVEEIKKRIDTKSYKIVIVDNASANGSGLELKQLYASDEYVKVIINEQNLGFAKGNNTGFLYIKEHMNADFIVVMNNDVYLRENSLSCKLQEEYAKSGFAALGPLIMTRDGKCNINPLKNVIKDKNQVIKLISDIKRVRILNKLHLLGIYKGIAQIVHNCLRKNGEEAENYLEKKYNVQLHGCFLVFSKTYIEKFDGFDDRTFLYMEEDILYKHMKENNMVTVYDPEIVVYHEEDSSTNSIVKKKREKLEFIYSHSLDSCQVLLDVYNYYENRM